MFHHHLSAWSCCTCNYTIQYANWNLYLSNVGWKLALDKLSNSPGAGTIKPEIISSLIIGGSDGGGGHTIDSMMSSVVRIRPINSGGSTRDDLWDERWESFFLYFMWMKGKIFNYKSSPYLIIMHSACSSCRTLSIYIISKSDTMAPLITIISSPLIIPIVFRRKSFFFNIKNFIHFFVRKIAHHSVKRHSYLQHG